MSFFSAKFQNSKDRSKKIKVEISCSPKRFEMKAVNLKKKKKRFQSGFSKGGQKRSRAR